MTDRRNTPLPPEAAARHFVQLGEAAIRQMVETVERARVPLASSEITPPINGRDLPSPDPYAWELSEPQPGAPKRVWFACVEDFGTGEELTFYFAAALARDEDEFRRSISLEHGRELANKAEVRLGVRGSSLASRFLPPTFVSTLEALDRGAERPATMSFLVRYRANYS